MVQKLEDAGLSFTGKDESGCRMEVVLPSYYEFTNFQILLSFGCASLIMNFQLQIVELTNHPYFVGVQFHPEFKSRPGKPSPLFSGTLTLPWHFSVKSKSIIVC